MATILRHFIDDIIVSLKQAYDDREFGRAQVAYWTIVVGNRLRSQHIGKRSSGAYLSIFRDVPVDTDGGRKYFELPKSVYDFNDDRAIDYLAFDSDGDPACGPRFSRNTFSRTTPKESEWLSMHPSTSPKPKNPYFYRSGDRVYLLGLEKVNVDSLEMGLFTTLDPITEIDIDAPFHFPEELLSQLKREVLDLGRFVLLVPEKDINDGTSDQSSNTIPTQKIVSVAQDQDSNQAQ